MKISILHPSRSRPDQAFLAMCQFTDSLSETIEYEYILSLDTDDAAPYEKEFSCFPAPRYRVIRNDNSNCVQASNSAAKEATGDILVLISDDFSAFHGWDLKVVEALKGKSGLLKTYDGTQKYIVTLPIMTRDYYESQGHIYYPEFGHMFCDTDQTHKADLQGKLIIRNDIHFHHWHYSTSDGFKKDEVNNKADKTWESGEETYLRRCREKFGLGKNVDIFKLSKEAHQAGHVAWLKKKLK